MLFYIVFFFCFIKSKKFLYVIRNDYSIKVTIDCFYIDYNTEIIDGITKLIYSKI